MTKAQQARYDAMREGIEAAMKTVIAIRETFPPAFENVDDNDRVLALLLQSAISGLALAHTELVSLRNHRARRPRMWDGVE